MGSSQGVYMMEGTRAMRRIFSRQEDSAPSVSTMLRLRAGQHFLRTPHRRAVASIRQPIRRRPAADRSTRFSEASAGLAARPPTRSTRPSAQEPRIEQHIEPRRPCAVTAHAAWSAAGIKPRVATTRPAARDESSTSVAASLQPGKSHLARELVVWPSVGRLAADAGAAQLAGAGGASTQRPDPQNRFGR